MVAHVQDQDLHREASGELIHVFICKELTDVSAHCLVGVEIVLRLRVLEPHSIFACDTVSLPVHHRISN